MSVFAAWLLLWPQAEPLQLGITVAGTSVGESRYERLADGAFRSTTKFSISGTEIASTVEGTIRADRIVRYKVDALQGAARFKTDYANGKLSFETGSKKQQVAYTVPANVAGNFHPQLSAALFARLSKLNPGEERKLSVYFIDIGSEMPCVVKALSKASVRVGTTEEAVRRYELVVNSVEIEYVLNARDEVVAMDVPGQRLRFLAKGWEGLYGATDHPELSAPTYRTERLKGVRMRTRDGVVLVADVVRPAGRGRFPAILERTPYGRETSLGVAEYWASRGYAFVAQDCRGREDSGGAWDPFVNEGRDGYDAVGWVAKQPWCDGSVGMIGGSYAGVAQWQAAVEKPPALKCIVPHVPPPDAMHNLPYEYGAFYLFGSLRWTHLVRGKKSDFATYGALPNPKGLTKLPLSEVDKAVFGKTNPIYQSWLRRPTLGDWRGFDHLARLPDSDVPALHISGWFDGDGIGTKLDWEAMRRAERKDQWLVYGPWSHAFNTSTRFADQDFGPTSRFDLDGLTLRFFDTYLKGKAVGMDEVPRAQIFVTGANRWVSMDGWPSSTSTFETLYLGTKTLSASPGATGASVFTYDPAKDTDVSGLAKSESTTGLPLPRPGTYAMFLGAPLDKTTAIAGPFEIRLFFKSSAKDTDLFGALIDIAPDGKRRLFGLPGKLRAAYRESVETPSLLSPGKTYTALLRPWDAAHELPKGHRIGLLVCSSLFPAFARNLGTGEPLATGKTMVQQRNVILTGTVTPSRITFRKLW